ncbi:T9SS type A sorting domain-containing protein [Flavobacterium sp. HXWNR69]|uniref:T9SS type A sorting domain-containing protein n=1 Tax=Flavobacterium fragile TaxID=2949085 RepID=A0ABT0TJB0_9FLAO|nr:T9SS type A sorting domain-containing protein [Flavobacterium sp. HXWNR69]MCL9771054.1 T9SS type A sorting domain-containing protein [Flavobacterium sp. HXWNR69]
MLYNVAGINPFLEKQITVIAPLKERVTSGTVTFRLLPSFMLQLTGLPIKNLVANFGTTTNYNLITNSVVSTTNPIVNFTTSGTKTFTFTVTFSNNTTETLTASMYIEVPPVATTTFRATTAFPLEEDFVGTDGITTETAGNIAFQGYNETTETKGTLEYRTYYNLVTNDGSTQSKIRKEIIILDGYDPGDGRKIYTESLGYSQDKSSLYELMYYDHDNNPATLKENLVEKLRNAPYGFDVTLVNFPAGADYIERNAMAVVSLLQRETAKLEANGSTEKIALIGPSMGGLISRYALAYMEKNNLNHNTRLWVSFDSPHLGANIPIGAQENLYFYGYKGRKDQAKIKFDENFRSPAARQMLIEQLDYVQENAPYPTDLMPNGTVSNGGNNNTNFRQQFQTRLNTNGLAGSSGYPQNVRKIAMINGTTNGTKTNTENQMFLELAAFKIIKYGQIFGTPLQTKINVARIEDRFMGTPYSTTQTFSGKAIYFAGWNNNFPYAINGIVTRTNINPRGSMDNVPGGTFNTQGIIKDEFDVALNEQIPGRKSIEWRTYTPNHAFIPTVSSLAFKNPNFNWSTALNRNLVCDPNNKEIYFDSYFAPSKNEEHVFVSAENANWLIKELEGNAQVPHFPIGKNVLSGPDSFCTNATYSFNDVCKIPSVPVWSVSGNIQIINQTDYAVEVVKTNADAYGYAEITATFQNGQKLIKKVWIGQPYIFGSNPSPAELEYFVDVNLCPVETQTLCLGGDTYENRKTICVAGLDSNSQWEIVKLSGNFNWNRSNNVLYIHPYTLGQISFKVRVSNSCGFSNWVTFTLNVDKCNSNGFLMRGDALTTYMIYPNPSKDMVYIDLRDQNNLPEIKSKVYGELYDLMGNLKSNVEIVDHKAVFSVNGLNKGIYVLKIYINGNEESHQIAVE